MVKGIYRTIVAGDHAGEDYQRINHREIPSIPDALDGKYIQNTKVVPNRETLLADALPKRATVAELGVDEGVFSQKILSYTHPDKLYLIDLWDSENYEEEKYHSVKDKFEDEIGEGMVEIIRERSEIALTNRFDDGVLDWVFIDTTHSYEQTKTELERSRQKVKPDGVIAGHDYCVGEVDTGYPYGVIPAVHEFCASNGWEISHLSLETHGHRSFLLKKL